MVTNNSVVSDSVVEATVKKLGGSHRGQGETHKSLKWKNYS